MSWRVDAGHFIRPLGGGTVSGDAVFTWCDRDRGLYAVIDALGHGAEAEISAQRAAGVLLRFAGAELSDLFARVHASMPGVRGVVMSAIHVAGANVSFAGIGNVEVIGPADAARPPCTPGVVGTGRLHLRVASLEVRERTRWGLVSDGIRQRDVRAAWEEAAALQPYAAAKRVLERAGRAEDDASVLVLDFNKGAP